MKTYYLAKGWYKFYEEDVYSEGCLPNTGGGLSGDETFKGATIEEVIKKCAGFVDTDDKENILLDSCDEEGRLDIQKYETDDSQTPTEREFKLWKQGKFRLWLSCYTFHIVAITEETVSLTNKEISL